MSDKLIAWLREHCSDIRGDVAADRIEQLQAKVAELEEENVRLRTVPMKYRRMQFNAQLQDENNELRAQLAAALEEIEQLKTTPPDKREDLRCVISDLCRQVRERDTKLASSEQRVAELEAENARLNKLAEKRKQQLSDFDDVIDDMGIAISCINPLEDLKRAITNIKEQLAAEQLNNKLLRDALQSYIDEHEECQDADDWMAMMCSVEAHHAADEALSQPSDTSALDAYVAEKVKDSESRTGNQSPCYTIARDMAVRMWEKHYKTDAPNWEPLDDFMGVLSQISNMLTGLGNVEKITRQRDLAVEALKSCGVNDGLNGPTQYFDEDLVKLAIKESDGK